MFHRASATAVSDRPWENETCWTSGRLRTGFSLWRICSRKRAIPWARALRRNSSPQSFRCLGHCPVQLCLITWQVIANHVKNCSDAFDFSIIALASVIPSGQFSQADGRRPRDAEHALHQLHIHDPRPPQLVALRQGVLPRREQESADAHRAVSLGR
ncbi:hypothetical protein DFH08DRAFT_901283 [Mycena albidolilacea]|uniref:Uncharacterized protein n=1 Tax=Mycena albidolilacea TaxID=1033008 RepID=A0AAD6Z4G8_9AGAR|nr:hypothetical protein DFH08DRAFT_901283 [Mycena albidolilacea]